MNHPHKVSGDGASAGPICDDIPLPGFIRRQQGGLWVDLSALDSPELLLRFVERIFTSGARFSDLDYELFSRLLFDYRPADIDALLTRFDQSGKPPLMRIAADIVPFPEERQALYRGVKLEEKGESAEYFFEQVMIDVAVETPVYGELDAAGQTTVTGYQWQEVAERAHLDFDEFIAALWSKGIRYGVDVDAVRAAIAADKVERLTIANQKLPRQGRDASVAELTDTLYRSDAPKILSDGRMDLCMFQNRFPQVTAGDRLFKKLPRDAGEPGWSVQGRALLPEKVKDFDIQTLAGEGTRVECVTGDGDYVTATINGFLSIDAQSGQLSVTEKIINREGVSAKTTGNLSLSGEEYEEHGEVQERRSVEGHHMTFHANVFGDIISDGGRIVIKQTLAGGSAQSPGGSIVISGSASRATLEARRGQIEVAMAESSLLIGQVVRVGRAVGCDIVADEVVIEHAEACAIAARKITIKSSTERRGEGTMVTLLLPDVTSFDKAIEASAEEGKQWQADETLRREKLTIMASEADMKTYLSLQPRINAGDMVLTPEQDANWQKLTGRLAPQLRIYLQLSADVRKLRQRIVECQQQIESMKKDRAVALAGVACEVERIEGHVLVRTRRRSPDTPALANLPAKELRIRLREAGTAEDRLFSGSQGSFSWLLSD